MKRCRTVSRKPPSPNQANQGSRSHNNLQSAHQLRVLTNYKDINGGGTIANQPPGAGGCHIYERSNITLDLQHLLLRSFCVPPLRRVFVSMIARINTPLFNERHFNELISWLFKSFAYHVFIRTYLQHNVEYSRLNVIVKYLRN